MKETAVEQIPLFEGGAPGSGDAECAPLPRQAAASAQTSDAVHPLSVAMLLALDEEYRDRAAAGTLPRITPKRLNPHGRAWLPILRTQCDAWTVQVMFSNTWRAHQFGRTDDWVLIHFERDGEAGQATVVTERKGRLRGKRVVRGRELESLRVHEAATSPSRLAG